MNLPRILAQLKAERRRLNTAITALEKVVASTKKQGAPRSDRSRSAATPQGHRKTSQAPAKGKLLQFRLPRTRVRRKPERVEEA